MMEELNECKERTKDQERDSKILKNLFERGYIDLDGNPIDRVKIDYILISMNDLYIQDLYFLYAKAFNRFASSSSVIFCLIEIFDFTSNIQTC